MIQLKPIARKRPTDKVVKYYATIANMKPMKTYDFIERIVDECTLTRADVVGCLAALERHIGSALRNGESVRFGDLGSFRLTVNSEAADTKQDVKAASVKSVKVRFTPSTRLRWGVNPKNPDVQMGMADEEE